MLGSLLGATVALPLGYALARSQLVADFLQPYLAASQALPAVALAPLLALWFGYGLISVIVLCALLVFFPIVVTTTLGLRLLDHEVLDAARVDGASGWKLLRAIELPLAFPSILAGLRAGLTLSITGAVVGEFVVGGKGLGELLLIDRSYADTAAVFADVLILAALAIACYSLARWAERNYSYAEEAQMYQKRLVISRIMRLVLLAAAVLTLCVACGTPQALGRTRTLTMGLAYIPNI